MEKLFIWIICDSLLNVVRCGVGVCLKFVNRLFLMIIRLLCLVNDSRWCVVVGDNIVLVGLWMFELVMYSCGECVFSVVVKVVMFGLLVV